MVTLPIEDALEILGDSSFMTMRTPSDSDGYVIRRNCEMNSQTLSFGSKEGEYVAVLQTNDCKSCLISHNLSMPEFQSILAVLRLIPLQDIQWTFTEGIGDGTGYILKDVNAGTETIAILGNPRLCESESLTRISETIDQLFLKYSPWTSRIMSRIKPGRSGFAGRGGVP